MGVRLSLLVLLVSMSACDTSRPVDERSPERQRALKKRSPAESRAAPPQARRPRRENRAPARSAEHRDVVERVVDGDTVDLKRVGTARLIGIDTPEVYGGVECFGRAASAFMKRMLPPGSRVRFELGTERRDRYGRALVYLHRGGLFVNAELVRRGFAQPYTVAPNVEHAGRFAALARRARELGRGLWSSAGCAASESRPRSCADFTTRAAAQRYFRRRPREAASLDGDGDGRVCEALP